MRSGSPPDRATAKMPSRHSAYACSSASRSRFLGDRHRHAGNLHLERAEARTRAEVDGLPVVAAEGDIGGVRKAMHDASEFLALRVDDVESARAAAIDVSGGIDLHAVGAAGVGSTQVDKNPVGLAGE